jgi:hypothetical protein
VSYFRRDFSQGHERKAALRQARVRHNEAGRIKHQVVVKQNVYVQSAGPPAGASLPAGALLGGEAGIKQLFR